VAASQIALLKNMNIAAASRIAPLYGVKSKLAAEYVAVSQNSPLNMLRYVKSRRHIL
jgi:hypothetical protein